MSRRTYRSIPSCPAELPDDEVSDTTGDDSSNAAGKIKSLYKQYLSDSNHNYMQPIIECVPNFSEGNDLNIIKQITDQIESVEGVRLLNVDPGKATNRTVVTIVGHPEAVINAAF